jgi:hypothetical protein
VLKLSTMWNFPEVRAAAIKRLSEMSLEPIDKLALAFTYDIDAWIVPVLNQLAQRQSLTDADGERIVDIAGLHYLMKLVRVRESWTKPQSLNCSDSEKRGCGARCSMMCVQCRRLTSFNCGSETARRDEHDFTTTINQTLYPEKYTDIYDFAS